MKLKRGEAVFILFLIAVLVVFVIASFPLAPGLRAMPLYFGSAGIVLLLLVLLAGALPQPHKWLGGRPAPAPARDDRSGLRAAQDSERPSDVARIMSYMVAFWIAVFVVGMAVAIPVFIAVFLALEAKVRLHNALLSSVIMTVLIIGGLRLAGLNLWPGVIGVVIPRYVGGAQMPLL